MKGITRKYMITVLETPLISITIQTISSNYNLTVMMIRLLLMSNLIKYCNNYITNNSIEKIT